METTDEQYWQAVHAAEEKLLHFLRTFESVQENIHFGRIAHSQNQLRDAIGDLFTSLPAELAALTPPDSHRDFHTTFSAAVAHWAKASSTFLEGAPGPNFGATFVNSRGALCRGLDLLYGLRTALPTLQQYWVLPDALPDLPTLEPPTSDGAVSVGMLHTKRTETHTAYSLYVPEYYTPQQTWPLIICLHGGYGRGDDYIWTWLRPAKSRGYLVLAPKSTGPTWSVLQPPVDMRSIMAMFEEVCTTYAVDRKRVYLTGLSDGGIYTYLLGLEKADLFAGIAPIAGELHPMTDALLRQKKGLDLPIFIVHGAHDFIFPVQSMRNAYELLQHIGYKATYTELPDWGHAYTYTINETLVMPWFESLGPKSDAPEPPHGKAKSE